jgi:hypothetical protein
MMRGLSSLFFSYDERRRPLKDTPAADQQPKNTINLPVPPCLKRGPDAGPFVNCTIFMVWVRTLCSCPFLQSQFFNFFIKNPDGIIRCSCPARHDRDHLQKFYNLYWLHNQRDQVVLCYYPCH